MDINEVVQKTAEETVQRVAEPFVRSAIAAALKEVTRQLEATGHPVVAPPPSAPAIVDARGGKKPHRKPKVVVAAANGHTPKDGVSVAKAAKVARVTPKTVYNAIETGKLQGHLVPASKRARRGAKDGKVTVVSLKDVRAWREATN